MYTLEDIERLVECIYAAALDSNVWSTFLTRLAVTLGGTLPVLHIHNPARHRGSIALGVGYDCGFMQVYRERLAEHNLWLRGGLERFAPGKIRLSHEICSRDELLRSQWWSEFCRPRAVDQAIGATIEREGNVTYNVSVLAGKRVHFDAQDAALLTAILPHLQRAVHSHLQFAEYDVQHAGFIEALELLPSGVLLVRADGRVRYMNRAAESLVRAADGLSVQNSLLCASRPVDTARLRQLVAEATETSAGGGLRAGGTMKIVRPTGRADLEVVISPLRPREALPFFSHPVAVLYVTDPERELKSLEDDLIRRYGLTATEAKVTALIVEGRTVTQLTHELDVTRNTIKTQLKAIFAKTSTRRQSEVIRLVLGATRAVKL